ncbi:Zinc finger RING-type [Arabidopsis suecica]|uniref:RING-type E3 ubiquitin transferase n=1 Tax=Arabidopsis suecica TaxID=45249 RepID=A0A8T2F519_ARASU|nr:Zinc finger RING-type [Arabidopsis suecica]
MVFDAVNPDPDSFVYYYPIYNDEGDFGRTQNMMFKFHLCYNLAPEVNSDGEDENPLDLETLLVDRTHEFDKGLLFSGDREQIQVIVCHILDLIKAPRYIDVVTELIDAILDLKKCDKISNVKEVDVVINVIVWRFPDDDDDDVDVRLAVAPASNEAVEQHLETVVVENESWCVICMDKIRIGLDVAAGRMPCSHVFHRTCGEDWLRCSGICPVCRAMFPT